MTLPALARLRASCPGAFIAVLTKPNLAPLFELSGVVDQTLAYQKRGGNAADRILDFMRLVADVRRQSFDTALLFQSAFEAALLAALARIPRRIGYATQGRSFLLTEALAKEPSDVSRHETLDYLAIVDAASGCRVDDVSNNRPFLVAGSEHRQSAADLLARHGVPTNGRPIVVLNPGATNSQAKQWPAIHFAELADRFERAIGACLVLVGAESEQAIAAQITSLAVSHLINLTGRTDLQTLIGLLASARLVVSNDTGTAHVAAALGRPTLTIFGPTNEFETAPLGLRSAIIRAPGIECQRCMLRECPIDHRCLTRISPDEVFSRAQRLLSELQ